MWVFLCRVAEKLKGLFLLFAGHFISNAVSLLDQNHSHKQGTVGSGFMLGSSGVRVQGSSAGQ